MKKIMFSITAVAVVALGFASHGIAAPPVLRTGAIAKSVPHTPSTKNFVNNFRFANYHVNYGTRFAHGYYYTGRSHNHWSYTRFDPRYGCNCYYDPYATCWYYWCQPANCYYPVTYCPYNTYCWSSCGSCGHFGTPTFGGRPVGPVNAGPGGPIGPGASAIPGVIPTPAAPVAPAAPTAPINPGPITPPAAGPQVE